MAFLTKSAPAAPVSPAIAARNGARWFYWIAGLSLLNSAVAVAGSSFMMLFGLDSTLVVTYIGIHYGGAALFVGVGVAVLVSLAFVGLGFMAGRRAVWAFVTGLVLYAADTLFTFYIRDWIAAAFHVGAIVLIAMGLRAVLRIRAGASAAPDSVGGSPVPGALPVQAVSLVPSAPVPHPPLSDGPQGFVESKAPGQLK